MGQASDNLFWPNRFSLPAPQNWAWSNLKLCHTIPSQSPCSGKLMLPAGHSRLDERPFLRINPVKIFLDLTDEHSQSFTDWDHPINSSLQSLNIFSHDRLHSIVRSIVVHQPSRYHLLP